MELIVHICLALPVLFVIYYEGALALRKCAYEILKRDYLAACCKADILSLHNQYRTMALDGQIPGQPAAKSMSMLEWDDSLAAAAQQVVDTCEFGHVQINSSTYTWVGQNMYQTSSPETDVVVDYKIPLEAWFSEYKNYRYPDGFSERTGHYTQLLWADTKKVGCASIIFQKEQAIQKFYVCNYGPSGNMIGQPPYLAK